MTKSAFDVLMSNASRGSVIRPGSRGRQSKGKTNQRPGLVQMKLDLGQSSIASTTCSTCRMVYHKGEPDDDRDHAKYHSQFTLGVDFGPISRLRHADNLLDIEGRYHVIRFRPAFSEKANRVLEFAYKDLGMDQRRNSVSGEQLYVGLTAAGRAIACALIIPLQEAFVPNESVRAKTDKSCKVRIGVELIWTLHSYRRQQLGSRLLDAAREHFSFGFPIDKTEMGFSQPTTLGVRFAFGYLGDQKLLVY